MFGAIFTFDFTETPFEKWLTKEALANKVATEDKMKRWKEELNKKTEQQEFFSLVNTVLVKGRKRKIRG